MRLSKTLLSFCLVASPALAQQAPNDAAFLQRAVAEIQLQRNQCLDTAAGTQAQLRGDLAKAEARIKELEEKK